MELNSEEVVWSQTDLCGTNGRSWLGWEALCRAQENVAAIWQGDGWQPGSVNQLASAAVRRTQPGCQMLGSFVLGPNSVHSYGNLRVSLQEYWSGLPPSPSLSNERDRNYQLGNLILRIWRSWKWDIMAVCVEGGEKGGGNDVILMCRNVWNATEITKENPVQTGLCLTPSD